jgi:hypothetical protein
MSVNRKVIDKLFLQHPAISGETYAEHLLFSMKTGWYLVVTSLALVFHGFVPKFCQTTASDRIIQLADVLQERRRKCGGEQ